MVSISVYLLVVVAVVGGAVFALFVYPARRRRSLARRPLPAQWQRWVADAVPHYDQLPANLRLKLEQRLKIFMAEKTFYGCDGLELNDRHRVTIAAQACLLVVNRSIDEFTAVRAILLYPSAFRVPARTSTVGGPFQVDEEGIVSEQDDIHLGESWGEGRIILSWADIEAEIAQRQAGQPVEASVVLHEFAHQLDQAEGISAAMPAARSTPARTLDRAYRELQQAVDSGDYTLLDPYGATDPAEFVAVATEAFFEDPVNLREADPDLYDVLSQFYRLDPAELLAGSA
jgi:Mlc titration factor MtfA (ptsG expression regulator)